MTQKIKCVIICLALLPFAVQAQLPSNRIRPAVMYYAGDTIKSPRLGLQTKVPQGWKGALPRESEVFLLLPDINANGEIYAVVNEKTDIQAQKQRWQNGFELSEGLFLKPDGEITMRGADVMTANVKLTGQNTNNSQGKFYIEAKCSPFGFCVVFLATADAASLEVVKKGLQSLVDNTVYKQPSNESPYVNFNWKKFLSGKILLDMDYVERSKQVDEVDMCADGTFHSSITRSGIFKGEASGYTGSKEGTWEVKSNNEKAVITFTFKSKKLAPINIELEARNDEIYIKGSKYFVGESDRCGKP